VPEPVIAVDVRAQVRPVLGLMLDVIPTDPLNPCWAVTVIVDVPACPVSTETLVELAAIAKSCTV
jgi:hypothetical protein